MKTLLERLMPYRVCVGFYTHPAWTFAGALEWAACYPPGIGWGSVGIYARGRWIATRK